jgi:hypothetical protein
MQFSFTTPRSAGHEPAFIPIASAFGYKVSHLCDLPAYRGIRSTLTRRTAYGFPCEHGLFRPSEEFFLDQH